MKTPFPLATDAMLHQPSSTVFSLYFRRQILVPIVLIVMSLSRLPVSGDNPAPAPAPVYPEPQKLELKDELGRGVQRFMKRLEESTPQQKNTVRLLFYGQSITEQGWTKTVSADLRQRYPNVNFIIENRAIGGFSAERLVLTSEADLYPFYPDLLIFYDYGRADRYEDMIQRTRERTTSEILLQTDHLSISKAPNGQAVLNEETDPTKLTMKQWNSWFPNVFIPGVAAKYHTGMVEQRNLWKLYCRENNIDPKALLADGTHLNEYGNFLMAKLVSAYLVRRPQYDDPAVENQIRDYIPGKDVNWNGNKLVFPFTGNKIDVIAAPGATGTADVLIDGKKPSEFPELYQATRVSGFPGIGWTCISRIDHTAPLVIEKWTATATDFSQDGKHFKFSVSGSVTGPDGDGDSDHPFVSKSGRVAIQPNYWNMAYSFGLLQGAWAKNNNKSPFVVPKEIVATWKIVPMFTDVYSAPVLPDPTVETPINLAQGLANAPHELQLIGHDGPVNFKSLRVYQPPLAVSASQGNTTPTDYVPTFAPPMQKDPTK